MTDVQRTLSYGSGKMGRTFLRLGLTALAACGVLAWLQPRDFSKFEWAMTYFGLVVGAACALYGLDRWLRPKPLLVLSPRGVEKCLDTLKTFVIPWHEVKGVETADITGTYRGRTVTVTGVTVVLVARAFYDQHIHVNSFLLRGPGWEFHFIPKGELVQVALHHESLPATAVELREAVAARWRAFRDKEARACAHAQPAHLWRFSSEISGPAIPLTVTLRWLRDAQLSKGDGPNAATEEADHPSRAASRPPQDDGSRLEKPKSAS